MTNYLIKFSLKLRTKALISESIKKKKIIVDNLNSLM